MNAPALIKDVEFRALRLPYFPELGDTFGIDNVSWKVLIDSIFPSAESADSVIMALSYCRARKLDVMKKPVHIVPMWSSALGKMVETVWPSIAEIRTTAFRTGQYAGCDGAEFGPIIEERKFSGTPTRGTNRQKREAVVSYPEWCRLTVLRILGGVERRFVGPKVLWAEAYAKFSDTEVPNDMWARRSFGQIEKCAEAAALRRAFPEEIGNEYTAEEMEGQRIFEGAAIAAVAAPPRPTPPRPPTLTEVAQIAHQAQTPVTIEAARETVAAEVARPTPPRPPAPKASAPAKAEPLTADGFVDKSTVIADFETQLAAATSAEIVEEIRESFADHFDGMSRQENHHCQNLYDDALARVAA